jgi:hypothetical protein
MRGRRLRHRGQRGHCFARVDEGWAKGQQRCNLGVITLIDGLRGWGLGGLAPINGGGGREAACGNEMTLGYHSFHRWRRDVIAKRGVDL